MSNHRWFMRGLLAVIFIGLSIILILTIIQIFD
jgi:hypothetical protein